MKYKRKALLTPAQLGFATRLEAALPDLRVSAQVSMSALLDPVGGFLTAVTHLWARRQFAHKTIDFVVSEPASGRVLAVIELDDRSHDADEVQDRDAARDAILEDAGYRILRWDARNPPSDEEIVRSVHGRVPTPAAPTDKKTYVKPFVPRPIKKVKGRFVRTFEPADDYRKAKRRRRGFLLSVPMAFTVICLLVVGLAFFRPQLVARFPALEKVPVLQELRAVGGLPPGPAPMTGARLLKDLHLTVASVPSCQSWWERNSDAAIASVGVLQQGAQQNCLVSTESWFGEQAYTDLDLYVHTWLPRIAPDRRCANISAQALAVLGKSKWSQGAKLDALTKIFDGASSQRCLRVPAN